MDYVSKLKEHSDSMCCPYLTPHSELFANGHETLWTVRKRWYRRRYSGGLRSLKRYRQGLEETTNQGFDPRIILAIFANQTMPCQHTELVMHSRNTPQQLSVGTWKHMNDGLPRCERSTFYQHQCCRSA